MKKETKKNILTTIYWATYLTLTMALFEHFNIIPGVVPFKVIGWMIIVEIPRVIIGMIIHKKIIKKIF